MLNSPALDVVIGLVFIYLLYSLLATTINEGIASLFSLRAKKLEKAITRMLDDGIMKHHNFWGFIFDFVLGIWKKIKKFFLIFSFNTKEKTKAEMSLVEAFYDHPGIKYLGENKIANKPAYISPEFFSKAVIDILKEKAANRDDTAIKQIQDGIASISSTNETKKLIQSLLDDANNDIVKFRILLEDWFNETMNRTSGWYKKQSQKITFFIGLILAITFNVDTISIVKKLSNDPNASKTLADMAAQYVQVHKDSIGHLSPTDEKKSAALYVAANNQVEGDINNSNSIIGLGWDIPSDLNVHVATKNALDTKQDSIGCIRCLKKIEACSMYHNERKKLNGLGKTRYVICMAFSTSRRLLGYLLTALAISFGAPFWFDLLNKIIQLRGAKKPEEPKDKKDKSDD